MDQRDSFDVNWSALLKEDGSLPYVPFVGVVQELDTLPVPKRAAVAPRPRHHDGIVVMETDSNIMGIADCTLFVETRWTCPGCRRSFKKIGRHSGSMKTCRTPGCGARFFLRMVPMA